MFKLEAIYIYARDIFTRQSIIACAMYKKSDRPIEILFSTLYTIIYIHIYIIYIKYIYVYILDARGLLANNFMTAEKTYFVNSMS